MKSTHKLWYSAPAATWNEALPLGNGRIGAMFFGGAVESHLQLNEDTIWSGYPRSYPRPGNADTLADIRRMLDEGRYAEAEVETSYRFTGPDCQSYLPMGDLYITFDGERAEDYTRELDIEKGIACAKYLLDGNAVSQEVFISHPDQALVMQILAEKPINVRISLTSQLKHITDAHMGVLMLDGLCPNNRIPQGVSPDDPSLCPDDPAKQGISFRAALTAETNGETSNESNALSITNATRIVIRMTARTSFNGLDKHPQLEGRNAAAACALDMNRVRALDYSTLKARHCADFASYMNRVDFVLGGEKNDLPTDARLEAFGETQEDAGLVELMFQYGRYLTVAASRPGTRATNLQGIWNDNIRPPWFCGFTTNINTEMNYWPTEAANLSEMHEPLFTFLEGLRKTGAVCAREWYNARGMVTHHNIDIWGHASPANAVFKGDPVFPFIPQCTFWPMSSAWMSRHMMDHFLYTMDYEFLAEKALPVLRDCVQFFVDVMVEVENGYYAVSPATSPENTYIENGVNQGVAKASAMNNAIVRELFANYIAALDLLHINEGLREKVEALLPKVMPYAIGSKGQLLEWEKEFQEADPRHRHVSHLYGLHPSHQITPDETPDLAAAAKQTLIVRGDEGTGWSLGWKINFWARLFDGEHALTLLKRQLRLVDPSDSTASMKGGGTYPNLLDAHPPFQIDGNFGACAGIGELFVQSRPDALLLLPALPSEWTEFAISGIKAMHDMEVSIEKSADGIRAVIKASRRPLSPIPVSLMGKAVGTIAAPGEYVFTA